MVRLGREMRYLTVARRAKRRSAKCQLSILALYLVQKSKKPMEDNYFAL